MNEYNKNKLDYPLKGFISKFHKFAVSQRETNLDEKLVHKEPSITFTGFIKNILSDKKIRRFLAIGYALEFVFAGLYILLPVILGRFLNVLLEQDQITYSDIFELIAIASGMFLIILAVNPFSVREGDKTCGLSEAIARRQLTLWAMGHSANWFSLREAGQIAHRISEVSKQINEIFAMLIWHVWPIIISLTVVTGFMFFKDLYAGLFFLVWSCIFVFVSIRLGITSQKFAMRRVKRQAEASGTVTDAIINHSLVRLFSTQKYEDYKVDRLSQQSFEAYMEGSAWAIVKNLARDTLMLSLVIAMIWILGDAYITGRINAGDFVSAVSILFILLSQVRGLHHIIRNFMTASGAVKEGLEAIAVPHDIEDIEGPDPKLLSDKSIEISDVNFAYQNTKVVLQDIDLKIPEGQKVGIVGPSGAGKTTLMALILRLWDVEEGAIKIGGENIKDISSSILRQNMALIPQDTSLFHRTLLENISYGSFDKPEAEIITASKKAHAHDFISELEDGYQTLVGERGVKLSGGQRQRIAIARAILKDAPILILDEATSALDSESEKAIQESLESLMEDKTVIAIAHRLSTINHLDRLIVMDKGKIIEDGTHEELLARNGLYAKLWSMQSGGFLGE